MRKGKILIVEDEVIIALDLKKTLCDLGYSFIKIVTSGEEAVKVAEEMRPDLILMDIKLQGNLNGIEAGEIIRSKFNTSIIYITAYSDKKTIRSINGMNSPLYVSKPFVNEEICKLIEKVFPENKESWVMTEGIVKW